MDARGKLLGHDPRRIANEFLDRAQREGIQLTPLQVQKLVYYAHAWMLGKHGRPMINEEVEVWQYGPVTPSVYYCLSQYRGDPISATYRLPVPDDDPDFIDEETAMLDLVFSEYAHLDGLELSARTHAPGTPWRRAKKAGMDYIPDHYLRKHYSGLLRRGVRAG